jgi:hypothetical protein
VSDQSRRKVLKSIARGGGAVAAAKALPERWLKPVVESVLLPAHAQTSGCASGITASSSGSVNSFSRIVVIVDVETGELVARCSADSGFDINAVASSLAPGNYYVLGDSEGSASHVIAITTECSNETLTYTTSAASCNILFATVSIPDGTITPGGGQNISGSWGCGSGSLNCA